MRPEAPREGPELSAVEFRGPGLAARPAGSSAVEITGLRKTFRSLRGGRRVALDGLDMTVPAGGVHGFLGPNGSGKTTTIRVLLGLVHADAGYCGCWVRVSRPSCRR